MGKRRQTSSRGTNKGKERAAAPVVTSQLDVSPLSPAAVREALAKETDRDRVFALLLRAIRYRASYAALLAVSGQHLRGRFAAYGDELDTGIAEVELAIDAVPALAEVIASAQAVVGPVATGDPSVDADVERLFGVIPPSALLLPISLRGRVVAIAIGHRAVKPIGRDDVSEIVEIAGAVAAAISRLILLSKGIAAPELAAAAEPAVMPSPTPTQSLEERAASLERDHEWELLLEVTTQQIELAQSPQQLVRLHARAGTVLSDKLDRAEDAIDAWSRVAELEPGNLEALVALSELERGTQAYHGLVDTLARLAAAGKASGRLARDQLVGIHTELARTADEQLGDSNGAIDAWREVLSLEPGNETALTALPQLLLAEERWTECVEFFTTRAQQLVDEKSDGAAATLTRAAELLEIKIGDRPAAASAYEKVRAIDPGNAAVCERLTELHRDLGSWEDLVDVLLERANLSDDPGPRSVFLGEVAEIYENELGEPASAYMVLQTALRDDPASDAIAESLERLAEGLNNWSELIDDETARAEALESSEPSAAAELWVRVGDGYIDQLGNLDKAIAAVRNALRLDGEHRGALASLTDLFTRGENWVDLANTLRKRAEIESDGEERLELLLRIGDVFEGRLDDPLQATEAFERALGEDSTCMLALVSLERLHKRQEQWRQVIDILGRLAELRDTPDQFGERVRLRLEVGEILHQRVGDGAAAIEAYKEVLALDSRNSNALAALEKLYDERNEPERYMEILEARLESTPDAGERVSLYERLASVWEGEFDRPDRAAGCLERLVEIEPDKVSRYEALVRVYRESKQWDAVLRTYRGELENVSDESTHLDVHFAMAEIFERERGDREQAIACLHEMLGIDATDERALIALGRLYEESGDWQRTVDVRMLFLESATDAAVQVDLLSGVGQITFSKLGDTNQGLYFLNRALELDGNHLPSLEALAQLHARREDWTKAADATVRAAALARGDACARLHTSAGLLFLDKLESSELAIEHLAAALDLDSARVEAARPLANLYFQERDWARLEPVVELLSRVAAEEDWPSAERAVIAHRAGHCALERKDHDRALTLFDTATRLDSTSVEALRARADLRFELESWVTAAADYRAILVLRSDDPSAAAELYIRLAEIHQKLGDPGRALDMLSRCLSVDPDHQQALAAILELRSSMGDHDGVIESLRGTLDGCEGAERADRLQDIGDIYREKLDNTQKALAHYREALELVPHDHRLLQKTLDLYTGSKQWKHAVDVIKQFLELESQPVRRASYFLAAATISLEELKDRESAATYLEQALDCYFEDGDQLTAATYRRALETFQAVDEIYTVEKDWKAQEQAYRRMIKRVGSGDNAVSATLWHSLGEVYRTRLKLFESALESFEIAHKLDPTGERASIIAELCIRGDDKNPEKSVALLTDVIAANPEAYDAYHALYQLYCEQGRHDPAWCVAGALVFLDQADAETRSYHKKYRPGGLVPTSKHLSSELWARLSHPDENRFISAILSTIWRGVAAVSAQPHKAFGLKRKEHFDLDGDHPVAAIFSYAISVLDIMPADVYLQADEAGDLMIANCIEKQMLAPAVVIRRGFLENKKREGAFLAAKLLSFLRPERFLKIVLSTNKERRTAVYAAIILSYPEFLVPDEDHDDVELFVPQIEKQLSGPMREELAKVVERLIGATPKLDVGRWAHGADATAHRLGLLVCGDLAAAARSIAREQQLVDGPTAAEKIQRLVAFSVSEDYFAARDQLGLSTV